LNAFNESFHESHAALTLRSLALKEITMANVLILGGGFGGVVAAESLARQLGEEHHITLVSRSSQFVFYPALVRLAFGKCEPDDVSFDLRMTMLEHRVNFIEAEVARVDLEQRKVVIAHGEVEGNLNYDYLIFALGRRLATERVKGFFEHSHHLLSMKAALKFRDALNELQDGHVVIGQCSDARLPVPVYETAFALRKFRKNLRITVVSPDKISTEFRDERVADLLSAALERNQIEYVSDFPVEQISEEKIVTHDGRELSADLVMLVPPFSGSPAAARLGITAHDDYIKVDSKMRVDGINRVYAVGDCVSFAGPKLGHMAVRQAEVAAENLAAEIEGKELSATYNHEAMMVIDVGEGDTIYFHKDLWSGEPGTLRQGRFWSWAKRVHERYWEAKHG
jgi:NADH dehydrogenase FAD-containing subunit